MDAVVTRTIFDRMAECYDSERRIDESAIITDAIRARLVGTENKRLIDYGCGTGLIGLDLADCFEEVILVDSSPKMVKEAQKKIDKNDLSNARALRADFSTQVPKDLQADYVILSLVLLHVEDFLGVLGALCNLVERGGHVIIVDFNENENVISDKVHNGFDQDELRKLFECMGFSLISSKTFYHGRKMFMGQDASLFLMDAMKG